MGNIQEVWSKIKSFCDDLIGEWGLILVVFLVALSSFGLGRLSAIEDGKPTVSVSQALMDIEPRGMALGGLVVASRNGSVYHFPWCAGASHISAANQVWYKSEKAARAAGYTPAKNCKGLDSN